MISREFEAMDTSWWVYCDDAGLLDDVELLVRSAEARLSRFLPDSALSRLNRRRQARDPLLAEVTRTALRLGELTGGRFDPTLGGRLAELGYDRTFDAVGVPSPAPAAFVDRSAHVQVDDDRVCLDGPGQLDLGGIAKGWTVDHLVDRLLSRGAREVIVDGGGDIRTAGGSWSFGVGEWLCVELDSEAVATSSTRQRRWTTLDGAQLHHILDPQTGQPSAPAIDTVSVVAADATTADALATAVLVDPDRLLPELPSLQARAAVRGLDGTWWTTPNWEPCHE